MAKYYKGAADCYHEFSKVNKSGIILAVCIPCQGYENVVLPEIRLGHGAWIGPECTPEEFNIAYKEAQNAIKDAYEED